ncbi:head decoration protein [Rheinheimera salexigens]|uniref:Head decoration protein n=1 Tax=Rheinheimera salexigens TaxID=1628148 RepID=A0A1E7Q878_9GAMM|nr:head decoration protein [Rheinheimera salexigens]OEY70337.1 hypothetical protein BI198_12720 [Rheinheimera salexigens]
MSLKVQVPNAGHYIKMEAGSISRDKVTFSGGVFMPGEVYAVVASKAVKLDFAASSGAELAKGIAYAYVDASAADAEGVATTRLTEVNLNGLTLPDGYTAPNLASAVAELAKSHIVVRGV